MKRRNLYPDKVLGRKLRERNARKAKPRPRCTFASIGIPVQFKGMTLELWTEDINTIGAVNAPLAFKLYHYIFAKDDEARSEYKKSFWNNQKGTMKKDFALAAEILCPSNQGAFCADPRSNTSNGRVVLYKSN